ncbi:hypothetical protein HanIR_Chr01g0022841 [Helianthus annuus]|nr:hypothetical protein HanIR_Chr01g0022841 [Helianthus annuus]
MAKENKRPHEIGLYLGLFAFYEGHGPTGSSPTKEVHITLFVTCEGLEGTDSGNYYIPIVMNEKRDRCYEKIIFLTAALGGKSRDARRRQPPSGGCEGFKI